MLPIYIIFQTVGAAVGAAQARQRQQNCGLVPPVPPPITKTPDQIAQEAREDRMARTLIVFQLLIGAVVFVTPFAAFVYCVIKIAFASKGIKWP